MILSGQTIRALRIVNPHLPRTEVLSGVREFSYGESYAGYDIRIDGKYFLTPGKTVLASSVERFVMPRNVVGVVHDKSSWARRGVSVQNTVLEPGWCGYLTLELLFSPLQDADYYILIEDGLPIAQVIFHMMDHGCDGYDGKYQNQEPGPQGAR